MSRHKSLLVCLIIIFVHNRLCPEAAFRSESSNKSRIANGEDAPEGKWPFIAAIFYEGHQPNRCGGTVLNDDSILTAAHCLYFDKGEWASPAKLTVYLGHVDLGDKVEDYLFEADKFFVHETYHHDEVIKGYNVAVIKLARTIDFSALENVAPVCLPDADTNPQTDSCIVMGWGETETGSILTKLLQADLTIQPEEECTPPNAEYDRTTIISADNAEDSKDWCGGDRGGPLVCLADSSGEEEEGDDDDEQSTYLQYGIAAYYYNDCGKGPSFYTQTQALVDWIIQKGEA